MLTARCTSAIALSRSISSSDNRLITGCSASIRRDACSDSRRNSDASFSTSEALTIASSNASPSEWMATYSLHARRSSNSVNGFAAAETLAICATSTTVTAVSPIPIFTMSLPFVWFPCRNCPAHPPGRSRFRGGRCAPHSGCQGHARAARGGGRAAQNSPRTRRGATRRFGRSGRVPPTGHWSLPNGTETRPKSPYRPHRPNNNKSNPFSPSYRPVARPLPRSQGRR